MNHAQDSGVTYIHCDRLAIGGEPPHDGGMEARVAKLEETMTSVRERLVAIETRLVHIEGNMATKLWVMTGAVLVLLAVVGGFWWIAQQYLAPILHATAK